MEKRDTNRAKSKQAQASKDKSNRDQATIQAKRRKHEQNKWQTPVQTCKNNAQASKRKQTRAKTIKGTDMLAMIQINTQDAKVHVLTSYERSFQMHHNSKPLFTSTATTITKNIVEFVSMKFQFEIANMHHFAP